MQTRTWFFLSLALTTLVWQPLVIAQEADTTYRLGFLTLAARPDEQASPLFDDAEITDAFFDQLRKLGYQENKHFVIERRYAGGEIDRLPALAAELVQLKVDLILTESTPATYAAQAASREIPIVFNIGADPVEEGFVASMSRPGGNITGFNWWTPSPAKQLQTLQEIVPDLKRVAILCPTAELDRCHSYAEWIEINLSGMGLEFHVYDVAEAEDFDAFFASARQDGAGGVLILDMAWFYSLCEELGQAAARSPLPSLFVCTKFAEAGGLVSFDAEVTQGGIRTAAIVSRILQGNNPGEIPVERPTVYELILNLKTARAWGIEIPASVLVRATHVIE